MGGVDVILSTSNSMMLNSMAIRGLRHEGRFINMAAGECLKVDPMLLISRQICVKGSTPRSRDNLIDVLGLAVLGKVRAEIETYLLSGINEAFARLHEGLVRYRAVVTQGGGANGI